jgi:phosphomannomutase/phosphoglucomutase
LLIAAGAFCTWEAWLIADEGDAAARTRSAQQSVVADLGRIYATKRQAFLRAEADPTFQAAIDDHVASSERLRGLLPEARVVEVYSAGLDEVVGANFRDFGYAKAAQLMAALGSTDAPTASTTMAGAQRRVSVAEPVMLAGAVRAWVWLEYPFDDFATRFKASSPGGGRLMLRQGSGESGITLLAKGSHSAALDGQEERIPGTSLYVVASMPQAFIVIAHSEVLAALLALIGLGGGAFLLWSSRRQPTRIETPEEAEVLLEDVEPEPRLPPVRAPGPVVMPAAAVPALNAPTAIDPSIFRAYDIRGVAGASLTAEVARQIGQAVGGLMKERGLHEIVVGRDGRL